MLRIYVLTISFLFLCNNSVADNDLQNYSCSEVTNATPVHFSPIKEGVISFYYFNDLIYLPNRFMVSLRLDGKKPSVTSYRSGDKNEATSDEYYGYISYGNLNNYELEDFDTHIKFSLTMTCRDISISLGMFNEYHVVVLKDKGKYFSVFDTEKKLWKTLLQDYLRLESVTSEREPR